MKYVSVELEYWRDKCTKCSLYITLFEIRLKSRSEGIRRCRLERVKRDVISCILYGYI